MTVTHHTGHVLDHIRQLPDNSVDLVATSPPFLALRDYNGLPDQWGSEPTPAAFLAHLLELTTELRRVLTPHGSIAIELGDTFAGSGGAGGDYTAERARDGQPRFDGSAKASRGTMKNDRVQGEGHAAPIRNLNGKQGPSGPGWPGAKSLCGTPTLFAWSLAYGRNLLDPAQAVDPWLVRNVIVWARANPPVGALGDKVRPATSYITVACPSPRRWFDLDAVRTPSRKGLTDLAPGGQYAGKGNPSRNDNGRADFGCDPAGAPPLDHWHDQPDGDLLWLINTQGSNLSHYAMWPPALAERLILSMCPAQVCRTCGEPRRRLVECEPSPIAADQRAPSRARMGIGPVGKQHTERRQATTIGWSECPCADYRPGVVLDPFAGTGTTLAVADIHGRDAIGIDLDPANEHLLAARYAQCWRALKPDAGPPPIHRDGEQLGLAL